MIPAWRRSSTAPLDRARPIYCIGDSNVIAYDRLACHDERTKTIYACRSIQLRRAFYSEAVDPAHALFHERLWSSLQANGLVTHASGASTAASSDEPIILIVFSVRYYAGFIFDLHEHDFVIPGATTGILATLEPGKELIPYDLAVERARDHLAPYIAELKGLRAAGFSNVFVVAMHPPHPDDDAFLNAYTALGRRTSTVCRYKGLRVFNDVLAGAAEEVGVRCLNACDRLMTDGVLNLKFLADHAHLNRAAARVSISTLLDTDALEWLPTHRPVYCFGDESIADFDNLVYRIGAGAVFACRAEIIGGQTARKASRDGGSIAAAVLTGLARQSVIQRIYANGVFELLWNLPEHAVNFVTGSGFRVMPIVLFRLGCRDLLSGDGRTDVALSQIVEPYVRALTILKERGISDVFACGLSEDLPNRERFNAELARQARAAGIAYVEPATGAPSQVARDAIRDVIGLCAANTTSGLS